MAKTFAYIRVSTREQNENRQLDSLQGLNIDEIFNRALSGEDNHFVIEKNLIEGYTFRLGKIDYDKADIENPDFNLRCNNLIKYVLEKESCRSS